MSDLAKRIADNLALVRGRIAAAAGRSGRSASEVSLVAVTKYVAADVAQAVLAAGCHDLGESRPQELWAKAQALGPNVRWHLIGHLQRNKVRRTLPLVHLIQSVDSRRLLTTLNEEAALAGHQVSVLLEANISGDATKTGMPAAELEPLLAEAARWPHVAIRGLMGMASGTGGESAAKRDFARLRTLREQLSRNLPPGVVLDELSMGMSGDYELAVEAGATIVRVGSALFEGLPI
jgi:pyridoxal phosphate enzyme (YggS family)